MSYFLNYKNGNVSIQTYRLPDASVTDVLDIQNAFEEKRDEILTASLDIFIEQEAAKIKNIAEKCETKKELDNYLFGDGDYLELMLEREFGIMLTDYPDLRALQIDQFDYLTFD